MTVSFSAESKAGEGLGRWFQVWQHEFRPIWQKERLSQVILWPPHVHCMLPPINREIITLKIAKNYFPCDNYRKLEDLSHYCYFFTLNRFLLCKDCHIIVYFPALYSFLLHKKAFSEFSSGSGSSSRIASVTSVESRALVHGCGTHCQCLYYLNTQIHSAFHLNLCSYSLSIYTNTIVVYHVTV